MRLPSDCQREPNDGACEVPRRCRILLADDHQLVLDMLRSLLTPEFDVVGATSDGRAVVQLAQALLPDMILLDVIMPGFSGLDVGKALRSSGCNAKLVYITMETDPALAAEAFALNASAYLSKIGPASELQRVLRLVAAGERYLTPLISNGDIHALCASHAVNPLSLLSVRELEVLKLLVSGQPMKAVARSLGITPRTVAFHKYQAMEKLALKSNSALIDFAVRHGLLGGKTAQPLAANDPDLGNLLSTTSNFRQATISS